MQKKETPSSIQKTLPVTVKENKPLTNIQLSSEDNTDIPFSQNSQKNIENCLEISEEEDDLKKVNLYKATYDPSLFLNKEAISSLICPLCKGILDVPVLEFCGCMKIFCKKCLETFRETNGKKCPETGFFSPNEPKPVPSIEDVLDKSEIKCQNYLNGCKWVGKFKDFKEHIQKNCLKEKVKCSNENCNQILEREKMEKHLKECLYRKIKCDFCKNDIQFNLLENHLNDCKKTKIDCPQGCGIKLERIEMEKHLNLCPNKIINCPYMKFGCTDTFPKNKLNERIEKDRDKHEKLMFNNIEKLENKIENLEKKFELLDKSETENTKSAKKRRNNKEDEIKKLNNSDSSCCPKSAQKKRTKKQKKKDEKLEKNVENDVNNVIEIKDDNEQNEQDDQENNNMKNLKNPKKKPENGKNLLNKKRKNGNADSENGDKNNQINVKQNYNQIMNVSIFNINSNNQDIFQIENNIITARYTKDTKNIDHSFVFFNEKFNIPKNKDETYKINFKLLEETKWLGFGICDKKIVEENNYQFIPKKIKNTDEKDNGCFIFSVNGMIWNTNNKDQRKKHVNNPEYLYKKGNVFEMQFLPLKGILDFYLDHKRIVRLTNIKLFKDEVYSPCLIFLQNSSVEVSFKYID